MVCRLYGAKPLSEPMLYIVDYTLSNYSDISMHRNKPNIIYLLGDILLIESRIFDLHWRNYVWKRSLGNSGHFFCLNVWMYEYK